VELHGATFLLAPPPKRKPQTALSAAFSLELFDFKPFGRTTGFGAGFEILLNKPNSFF
jgi:hypothetical protein